MTDTTPSCQRSLEEVVQSSYIADALGISLYEALKHGDEWHKSDAAFHLDNGVVLIYEHDPVYWHPDERMQGDCDKTEKLLRYENTLVVRSRVGATELPIEHPRLIQLMVHRTIKPERLMYEFARVVHHRLPEPYRSKLRDVGDKKRMDVETHASTVFRHIHPDYDTKLRERTTFLQEYGLTVEATTIVGTPLSTLRRVMDYLLTLRIPLKRIARHSQLLWQDPQTLCTKTCVLQQELGMTNAKIAVNPNLLLHDPESLRTKSCILQQEFGITKAKIVTHAKLLLWNTEILRTKSRVLQQEFGMTRERIAMHPQLLSLNAETLRTKSRILQHEFGITRERIAANPALLSLDPETLRQKGEWLRHHGFDWTKSPMILGSNLDRMKVSLDFLVDVGISRQRIKKKHVQRLTPVQMKRRYTHASFSTMDESSKLRILLAR